MRYLLDCKHFAVKGTVIVLYGCQYKLNVRDIMLRSVQTWLSYTMPWRWMGEWRALATVPLW